MDPLPSLLEAVGARARAAARSLALASADQKNRSLDAIASALDAARPALQSANAQDLEKARADQLAPALIDRLTLTEKRIDAMIQGVRDVIALPDPIGESLRDTVRPNGLRIVKQRVPLGVIAIIFESRPNVTCDAAVLCLKAGNATILRGGKEAIHSNGAIADAMRTALDSVGLPTDAIQLVPTTDRAAVPILCRMDRYLDVIIPRGGHSLIQTVVEHARVPVIKHYDGICHVFVDRDADLAMAEAIVVNAKCQRPGVCNAMETLLIDEAVASQALPRLAYALRAQKVELRGDAASRGILPDLLPATDADWSTEYLDLILSIAIVPGVDGALDHIERFSSRHSDAIVTRNAQTAARFLQAVDSAAVFWNASTRFSDGAQFGLGAEIGISTDKLHARGPMGLEELTSYKYLVTGTGQTL